MERREIDARAYVLVGPGATSLVEGELVRKGFRSLHMPHQVLNVRARDASRLQGVVEALRSKEIAGASFLGETGAGVLELADVVDASAARCGEGDQLTMGRTQQITVHSVMLLAMWEVLQDTGRPRTVAVVGAGAAARAAVVACRDLGVQVVVVTSPTWGSTEVLHECNAARRMREHGALTALWPGGEHPGSSRFSSEMRLQFRDLVASADLLVHAPADDDDVASVGEDDAIVPWPRAHRDAFAIDLYYRAAVSPFLRGAMSRGLRVVGGVEMLARVTVRRVEMWTGLRPDYESVLLAARRLLAERPQ